MRRLIFYGKVTLEHFYFTIMRQEILKSILEFSKIIIIALLIVVPIRMFVMQPFFVKGASMENSFYDGEYLIIDELSYRFKNPERGDVVVFRYPLDNRQYYIKRIIGLPGDKIEINAGEVVITGLDGQSFKLDETKYLEDGETTPGFSRVALGREEYFVLGDNRAHSSDSRNWGALSRKDIVGKVSVRAWPVARASLIEAPNY